MKRSHNRLTLGKYWDEGISRSEDLYQYMSNNYKHPKMYYMWHNKPDSRVLNCMTIVHTTWECETELSGNDDEDFKKIIKEMEEVYINIINENCAKGKICIVNIHALWVYDDKYYMRICPTLVDKIRRNDVIKNLTKKIKK